jgi:hypothetical protein
MYWLFLNVQSQKTEFFKKYNSCFALNDLLLEQIWISNDYAD